MLSRKKTLLITRSTTFFAAMRRHSFVARLGAFVKGDNSLSDGGDRFRYMSSNNASSRYYDYENKHVTKRKKTMPAQALNGIAKNDEFDEQQKGLFPPEANANAGTLTKSSQQTLKKVGGQNLTDTSIKTKVDAEDLQSSYKSPFELSFPGDTVIPVTSRLHIVTPEEDTPKGIWPIFRIMDEDGTFRDGSNDGYHHHDGLTSDPTSPISETANRADNNSMDAENENENDLDLALSALRDSLCKTYPNLSSEIEQNDIFLPSKFQYADTDSKDTLKRLLRHMLRLREMDTIFQNAQRQGRISFYLTCRGEEAMHFGATSALERQDVILGQYREQGPLMWRGFTLQQFADQCFSNEADLGKGRQMPIHYGSRALNYQTISSPLGTQIPQAVGVAYRMKLSAAEAAATESTAESANDDTKKAVSICFFGEGCTSTNDFHSGLNFAATLKCPVIFFCRNNGYAISTSVKEQFASDGVVSKAPGYGMAAIRVDGNDIFAVHAAVREARAYALKNTAPVLIEAMSYRQGHHSTSDDSFQYRSAEEVEHFADQSDPLNRLQNFFKLHEYDNVTEDTIQSMIEEEKEAILDALRKAERKPKPSVEELFKDVYTEMPPSLKAQQNQLNEHIAKYPDSYTL